jgi:hypothetical protein
VRVRRGDPAGRSGGALGKEIRRRQIARGFEGLTGRQNIRRAATGNWSQRVASHRAPRQARTWPSRPGP